MVKKAITYLLTALTLTYANPADAKHYTLKKGDNLERIADEFERSIDDLLVCNPSIKNPDYLKMDQVLKLSTGYTVKKGDSLRKIADNNGTTVSDILEYNKNKIADADEIFPGLKLELPCRKAYSSRLNPVYDREKPNHQKKPKPPTSKTLRFPSGLELEIVSDLRLVGTGKEFYDPNHAGVPLVRVPRSKLTERVSEHFSLAEFAVIPTSQLVEPQYKQRFAGDDYFTYIRLDSDLIKKLEQLRNRTRRPLHINSGYRSYGYNSRLYRKIYHRRPTISRHMSGDAVDIRKPQLPKEGRRKLRRDIEKLFKDGGVGYGGSFIHLDDRGRKARWTY